MEVRHKWLRVGVLGSCRCRDERYMLAWKTLECFDERDVRMFFADVVFDCCIDEA